MSYGVGVGDDYVLLVCPKATAETDLPSTRKRDQRLCVSSAPFPKSSWESPKPRHLAMKLMLAGANQTF